MASPRDPGASAVVCEVRRAVARAALRAQRAPLILLGAFDAVGAGGLALLGRPDCAAWSFATLLGADVVIQAGLRRLGRTLDRRNPERVLRRLGWVSGARHAVLLAGAVTAWATGGGQGEAFYLALAGAAVLLLATFQCAFDRRLLLVSGAPGAVALCASLLTFRDRPYGGALLLGGLVMLAVCLAVSRATRKAREALSQREVERAAMLQALERSRDEAQTTAGLLAKQERLLSQTSRMARIGGWEYDARSRTLVWSRETYRIHGVDPGEAVDLARARRFFVDDDRRLMHAAMERLFAEGIPFDEEVRLTPDRGGPIWVRCLGEAEVEDGRVVRAFGAIQDVHERRQQERRVYDLAYHDALTGLPNRTRFQEALRDALEAAARDRAGCGLILVDLDNFKDVNDTLGHDAGDQLLRATAERLTTLVGASGVVTRLGGDEFAVVVPHAADEPAVLRLAQAACDALARPVRQGDATVHGSATLGAVFVQDGASAPAQLLKNADIALYEAKAAGRNRAALFEPAMRARIDGRFQLLREVRDGIDADEFEPWFQPIVEVEGGAVAGLEALMRWRRPGGRVSAPGDFLAALEDRALSLRLGDLMLERVLRQLKSWRLQGVAVGRVAVNLSHAQFRRGDLAEHVGARLRHWALDPAHLAVEITETVYLGDGSATVERAVRALHDLGVQIALDDFGTGYASLANLRQLPIDVLKIDRSFLDGRVDSALVRTVTELGARLGMLVTAEGVETAEQLAAVAALGCDRAQGHLFARAMPAAELQAWLLARAAREPQLARTA